MDILQLERDINSFDAQISILYEGFKNGESFFCGNEKYDEKLGWLLTDLVDRSESLCERITAILNDGQISEKSKRSKKSRRLENISIKKEVRMNKKDKPESSMPKPEYVTTPVIPLPETTVDNIFIKGLPYKLERYVGYEEVAWLQGIRNGICNS